LLIEGGQRLSGAVDVEATRMRLPLLAACLMTFGRVRPDERAADQQTVEVMRGCCSMLGALVEDIGST